mmetsp:Transcript_15210/g.45022  ORF Transcript_15210/g.45022 Transcript_15210/m.45022 type:complete len:219 (+) Transcript_15210:1441-2097(+)
MWVSSSLTCRASSRVGAMITSLGPRPRGREVVSEAIRSMMGSPKAIVFPVPVRDRAMMSRPVKTGSKASRWMGVNSVMPLSASTCCTFADTLGSSTMAWLVTPLTAAESGTTSSSSRSRSRSRSPAPSNWIFIAATFFSYLCMRSSSSGSSNSSPDRADASVAPMAFRRIGAWVMSLPTPAPARPARKAAGPRPRETRARADAENRARTMTIPPQRID